MRNKFLESRQRGTPDLPFAKYHFTFHTMRITSNTHWHPEQEILYVKNGALNVMVGKTTLAINENEICFVAPNALHGVITTKPDTEYYAFVYSYDLFKLPDSHFFQNSITDPLRQRKLTLPATLRPNDEAYQAVTYALEQICNCQESSSEYKFTVFGAMISLYAALHDSLIPISDAENPDNQAVKMCLDYMHSRYAEHITLDELAGLVHLHPNYLCNLFKSYTGQTAFQQLMHIRLDNAAQMLKEDVYTVSQIANMCGFESNSFFSRKFKEIKGLSPIAYRKQKQKSLIK